MGGITYIKYWQSKHQRVLAILSPLRVEKIHVHVFRVVFPQNMCVHFQSHRDFFLMWFFQQCLKMFPTKELSMLLYVRLLLLF